MKRNWKNKHAGFRKVFSLRRCLIVGATLFFAIMGCSSRDEAGGDTYTCPMHPTVTRNEPGTCPVCGMDLVRKTRAGQEVKMTEDLSRVMKSPNEVVVSSIKTIKGQYKSVAIELKTMGVVTYDTRNIYTIPARAGGRLEKVYLNSTYETVRKGQKIAEIYSPELMIAQRELLFLLENDSENSSLIQLAKRKLELLGVTMPQIRELLRSRQEQNTFALYSSYDGYVITDKPAPATTSSPKDAMQTTPATARIIDETEPIVREGDYVAAGQTLFKVVNTSALRIEMGLPGAEAGSIQVGDSVTIALGENEKHIASVDFVQPFYDEGAPFTRIRLYMGKTEDLRIGQLVTATVSLKQKESLWVPRSAVVDLGAKHAVFIRRGETLIPKSVTTGLRSGDLIEIVGGLASSDEIAANAHFLVDSESSIKPAN